MFQCYILVEKGLLHVFAYSLSMRMEVLMLSSLYYIEKRELAIHKILLNQ